jgi:SsrA-binding protein
MTTRIVCQNKKAAYNYFLDNFFEAGMVLLGPEVKSLRAGQASLTESFARIKQGEVFLYNMYIKPYSHAQNINLDPVRPKKLLLNKKEIKRLIGKTEGKGYTLVPTKVYFSKGWAKVELALARGKRKYDKRQALKEKELKREIRKVKK